MEILQHLLGKSSRKSWKQAHLMEHRDLRSSEEAKRWQQRFCGPTTATFFNFMTAVAIIMANKLAVALVVVSMGVAVATITDIEFSFFGACTALRWIIPSSLNKILWSNLQKKGNWTALALMWKSTPITILFFMVLAPLVDPEGFFSFSWNMSNITAIIVSALLGFLLQWSGALTLGATSPTSHAVLGQFKTCVILLGGYLFFDRNQGTSSICGATIALTAMFIYTYLSVQDSKVSARTSKQLLPEYNTLLSKHKTDSDLKNSVISICEGRRI